jgi:plasmid stabilization system protein ParE
MTRLRWSTDAEADVDRITDYIAEYNPAAAIETRDKIETRVKLLKTFPMGWKTGRVSGTREMVLAATS